MVARALAIIHQQLGTGQRFFRLGGTNIIPTIRAGAKATTGDQVLKALLPGIKSHIFEPQLPLSC